MPQATALPESLTKVLHQLDAWWSEPGVPRRAIRSLSWGGRELKPTEASAAIVKDELLLKLEWRDPGGDRPVRSSRAAFEECWNEPIDCKTEDGWRIAATSAVATNWSASQNADGTTTDVVTIKAWDWFIENAPRSTPRIWVNEIEWDPPAYSGNLVLAAGGGWSRGHYFLRGEDCDYALIAKSGRRRWFIVASEHADCGHLHNSFRRDFSAMAFSFGASFGVRRLYAVDENLRVVAVLGSALEKGLRANTSEQGPVPSTNDFAALPVVMFEAVSAHLTQRSPADAAKLVASTWYFNESLAEYSANSSLAKMTLSVIAAARYLLGGDIALVSNPDEWRRWVGRAAADLESLEHADRAGKLREQVRLAGEASAETIVRMAFEVAGIGLLPELEAALSTGLACLSGESVPVGQLYEFLPRLRALASALIARAVGYHGRISGWQRAGEYAFHAPPPDGWWKCDRELKARQYIAESTGAAAPHEAQNVWPSVPLPEVPSSGPIAVLVKIASTLGLRTDGRVYADVTPLPLEGSAERRYEFSLRAARRASAKSILFYVRARGDSVDVEGWQEPVTLTSSDEVERFVRAVAESPQTVAAIERLLLAALEAERDAAR